MASSAGPSEPCFPCEHPQQKPNPISAARAPADGLANYSTCANHQGAVLIDAASLPPHAELDADVAIVGAAPAGITLALELAGAGHSVALIESGSDSFDAEVQQLGDAVLEDPAHMPMSQATRRQLGGASNVWGGRCVPFDQIDFQSRQIAGN